MTGPIPALPADLDAGLRRLRLGAMRRLAPELLVTAKTQRWAPEELLRTLVETEIASRDANADRSASDPTGPSKTGDASSQNTPPPSASSTGSSTTPTSSPPQATPTA